VLNKDIAFVSSRGVQRLGAQGGWVNGDASFEGPNPPNEAVITYYQKKRHIFGDLTIDVLDAKGNVVGSIPSSKRRGLNRVTWAMRVKAPRIPTAASAAFGAATGPRYVPGDYTVRMTKDKNVYTTTLAVTSDPRAKYSAADRQAQFDLAMKLHKQLGEMTYATDKINGVRLALDDRASKYPPNDALKRRLQTASQQVDALRKKIVATKEGGMITGEERLREFLTDTYSNVVFYEGRPSVALTQRADSLAKELADVVADFDAWAAKQLPPINSALEKKKLAPIKVLTREEWEKSGSEGGGGAGAAMERDRWERD
jgi:hypothetical protein